MTKRVIAIGVVILVIAAGGGVVLAKRRALQHMTPPAARPLPVHTALVRAGGVADAIVTVALVQADVTATAAAQTPGAILEMRLREGARVRQGEVLAIVDPRPLEDAAQAAEARLAAAREALRTQEAVFARDQVLVDGGAASRQAFELSRAQLETARANDVAAERAVATARVQRGYASVAAPYAGIVTARLAEPGDLAAPGKPLYTIQSDGGVRLISKLSQEALQRLAPGGEATFSWQGQRVGTKTSRIYPALDASHLGTVETTFASAPFGLPAGSTVEASYGMPPSQGLVVPAEALVEGLNEMLIVKVVDGKAQPVPVTLVARGTGDAVVRGVLAAGDAVVVGLPSELMALTAGTPLAPVPGLGR
jgi:RND family efflux transporter MFP subunit